VRLPPAPTLDDAPPRPATAPARRSAPGSPGVRTPRVRLPAASAVAGGAFVLWGLAVGLGPIHDNSFLTELATGHLVLAHGVPRADPFTFTAAGRPWVVESWLASVLYALVDDVAGGHGLVLLHGALCAALGALGWRLTRPARHLPGRLLSAAALCAVGTGYWSPRPLLVALVCFAAVAVQAETGRGSPWWAVPVLWCWVNVHGSWPLALVYLGLRWAGAAIEGGDTRRRRALFGAAALGAAAGAANPLGPGLLLYPLAVVRHHQAFATVAEWQAPNFGDPVNAAFGVAAVLALALVALQRRRRPGWAQDALVAVVFTGGALVAARNVAVAALVLTPVLARGLEGLGTVTGGRRGVVAAGALVVLGVVGGGLVAGALDRPAYDLSAYPVGEVTWMARHHLLPGRVATPDYVGNYLELRYGTGARAFFDDRVDVFSLAVVHDYDRLLLGRPGWAGILRRLDVHAVLWPRSDPLARDLARDPAWRVRLADRGWIVAVRGAATSAAT